MNYYFKRLSLDSQPIDFYGRFHQSKSGLPEGN
jgi:hypothetical protein